MNGEMDGWMGELMDGWVIKPSVNKFIKSCRYQKLLKNLVLDG